MQKKAKEIIDSATFIGLPDQFDEKLSMTCIRTYSIRKQNIPMLNRRLKMLKLLKQKHKPQTVNFQNLNRNLTRLTTQQHDKNQGLMLLI